jgi:hypothetical protein
LGGKQQHRADPAHKKSSLLHLPLENEHENVAKILSYSTPISQISLITYTKAVNVSPT